MKPQETIGIREAYMYRHSPECMRVLADFFWRILLSAAFAVLLFSLSFGMIELSSVIGESGSALSQSSSIIQPAPKLSRTQLQNTLNAYSEREDRFNGLKTGAKKISDPSR
ncbi:MAG: hypothetical protein Q7S01_03330 [bacterium]|nr:hypothetical protein [bacterium]